MINPRKAQVFVQHIQDHLDSNDFEFYSTDRRDKIITPGKVGCMICMRDIEQIWEREK